jgi:hypothetical protein
MKGKIFRSENDEEFEFRQSEEQFLNKFVFYFHFLWIKERLKKVFFRKV